MFFLLFLLMIEGSGPISLTNGSGTPGGPKTYGSYGSRSATLLEKIPESFPPTCCDWKARRRRVADERCEMRARPRTAAGQQRTQLWRTPGLRSHCQRTQTPPRPRGGPCADSWREGRRIADTGGGRGAGIGRSRQYCPI
jgi:hypothetical protein